MKALTFVLAVICAVGVYLVARVVITGPAKPASSASQALPVTVADSVASHGVPATAGTSNDIATQAGSPVPSWRESPYTTTEVSPPPSSGPWTIGPLSTPPTIQPPMGQGPPVKAPVVQTPIARTANPRTPARALGTSYSVSNPMGSNPQIASAIREDNRPSTTSPADSTSENGDSDSGPHVDIAASMMLGLMDKRYHRLGAFAATVDIRSSDNPYSPLLLGQIAFRRNPERAVALLTAPQIKTVLYDGGNVIVYPSPDTKHFTKTANYFRNLRGSGISTVLGRLVDDPSRDILSRLIAADYNSQRALEPYESLDNGGTVMADGVVCDRVVATRAGDTVNLLIGRHDHLLRRITWMGGSGANQWYYLEDFRQVRTDQTIPASLFAFRAPSGITQYATSGQ